MKYLFAFLISILPFAVSAQSNYYPGYILKNNGDTAKGFINYHEWTTSPHSIDFRENKDGGETQHFDPQTIKGFGINGLELYSSYTGVISTGQTNFSGLHRGIDTGNMTDTVFLKQIAGGRFLKLYYHGDNIKTRFFIAETDGSPVELNYYEYINDSSAVTKSEIYKGQLILYANKFRPDNDKLTSKIGQINYDEQDLQNIVDEINGTKTIAKKRRSYRLYTGFGINQTTTKTGHTALYNGVRTSSFTSPTISAGIDIFSNPTVQQLIFRGDVSFSYIDTKFKGVYINSLSSIDPLSFNQYTFALIPQLLFNIFNKTNVKVYIDAGVGFNFSAYNNSHFTIDGAGYTIQNFWTNFPFQAGIVLNKKIEIFYTYAGYQSYSGYAFFYLENQTNTLGIKYLLGK